MKRIASILQLAGCLLLPTSASAFGLKTHLWIGQQMIDEINRSCYFKVAGVVMPIEADLCQSIHENPGAFLAGTLGPDVYPDLITGQVTTHPGIEGDWRTADWLVHLYSGAKPGADLAFAAGYVVHAASDVFAHTYVNGYAGDIFILTDEVAVERRHFVLEKYIDSKLPGFSIKKDDLTPVTDFVTNKLIFDSSAGRLANKSGAAGHISAMNGVRISVEDLADKLDHLEEQAGKVLADAIATYVDLHTKITTGELQLAATRETLRLREQQLGIQQKAYDEAEKIFNQAADAYERNRTLFNQQVITAQAARAAAEAAQKAGNDATNAAADLAKKANDLQAKLNNTPKDVLDTVCHKETYETGCTLISLGGLNPFTKKVCDTVTKEVCQQVTKVAQAWTDLNNAVTGAKNELTDAQARAAQAAIDVSTNTAKEAAALQEKIALEIQEAALKATRTAASAAFDLERGRLEVEKKATVEVRENVERAERQIAEWRKQIIDAERIREAVKKLVADSDILSGYAHNWVKGIKVAGREYILTSHRVGTGMVVGDANLFSEYLHWYRCYGSAFTPKPYQVDETVCKAQAFYEDVEKRVDQIIVDVLPPPAKDLYLEVAEIKDYVKNEVKYAVEKGALELVKMAAPNKTTADFIDLLANPENATASKLNEVYATIGDADGKDLLTFQGMSGLVDSDLHLQGGRLNPDAFAALHHARQLAKLALLDHASIRNLTWVLGGDAEKIPAYTIPGRYSILYSMVRSIDGNHQWQAYGLPYARAASGPVPEPAGRHYGYGVNETPGGFVLFSDPDLRQQVFSALFNQRISGSLADHPRLKPGQYPFPECARNPFPVAMNENGQAAANDPTCEAADADVANERKPTSFWRLLRLKLGLAPY